MPTIRKGFAGLLHVPREHGLSRLIQRKPDEAPEYTRDRLPLSVHGNPDRAVTEDRRRPGYAVDKALDEDAVRQSGLKDIIIGCICHVI